VLKDQAIPESRPVADAMNIHYTGKYCQECHEKTPIEGGEMKKEN
jgi:hypothetical protein